MEKTIEGNDLIPFDFDGLSIRMIEENGVPWFVATDVCKALGHVRATDAIKHLDDDERGMINCHTLGGPQGLRTVNESGLYSLILRSRKDEAKRFKRWVTAEVLPTIRRTGHFSIPGYLKRNPELGVLESAASSLRMNNASIIGLYHNFGNQHGISTGSYLPIPMKQKLTPLPTC